MELNELHILIVEVLIEYAKNKDVISYSELCNRTGYGSPENMGKVLDPLTKFTYDNCNNIFISALVVRKDTMNSRLAKPGVKFFEMCRNKIEYVNKSDDEIVIEQRNKIFKYNWSNLPNLVRNEINKNHLTS